MVRNESQTSYTALRALELATLDTCHEDLEDIARSSDHAYRCHLLRRMLAQKTPSRWPCLSSGLQLLLGGSWPMR